MNAIIHVQIVPRNVVKVLSKPSQMCAFLFIHIKAENIIKDFPSLEAPWFAWGWVHFLSVLCVFSQSVLR